MQGVADMSMSELAALLQTKGLYVSSFLDMNTRKWVCHILTVADNIVLSEGVATNSIQAMIRALEDLVVAD